MPDVETHQDKNWLNNYKSFSSNRDIKDLTFLDLWNEYEKYIKLNLKYQSYIKTISKFKNHILPYFSDFKVLDINHIVYVNWKLEIEKKGYSYKYVSAIHHSVVNILNYAMKFYNLTENVASKVGNFKKSKFIQKKFNVWTVNEFKKFISVVDENVYKLFFMTLFFTGLRVGECIALTWEDYQNGYIDINKTISKTKVNDEYITNSPKTNSSNRRIKLTDNLIYLLDKEYERVKILPNFSHEWYIFGGIKPLTQTTIGRRKDKYCELANVKKIKIHEFRHSHATLLTSQNVPITNIAQRLGHSDTNMTLNTYSHFVSSDEDKTINVLNSISETL